MKLLSIDWDFFFPVPDAGPEAVMYDWGHSESKFYMSSYLWRSRAIGFLVNGLPLPGLSGEEQGFWKRFDLSNVGSIQFAESHADIMHLVSEGDEITNYDAHHDAGYGKPLKDLTISCEDWAHWSAAKLGCTVKTVYPRWKLTGGCSAEQTPDCASVTLTHDNGLPDPTPYDAVFVCRSGAWTPPWVDKAFDEFLLEAGEDLEEVGELTHRPWWDDAVLAGDAARWKVVMAGPLDTLADRLTNPQ